MTVEVESKETQMPETVVSQPEVLNVAVEDVEVKKCEEAKKEEEDEKIKEVQAEAPSAGVQKSSSFKEESNFLSDLNEHEKKALSELKAKLEEAILGNTLFEREEKEVEQKEAAKHAQEENKKEKSGEPSEEKEKSGEPSEEKEKSAEPSEEKEKSAEPPTEEKEKSEEPIEEKAKSAEPSEEKEKYVTETQESAAGEEEQEKSDAEKTDSAEAGKEKEKSDAEKVTMEVVMEEKPVEINKDISLWGVPLLPSKGSESTDVVLLKFLRARDFRVADAFQMLQSTLIWRRAFKADSILDEDLGSDLGSVAYMNGVDREGHPICYNIYGVFENDELYQKTFGTEAKREQFLRWRVQLMEKGIKNLNFKPGGVSSLMQINDLKNSPGPSKKDLRLATKRAVGLLQDNYPEFVARNIFVNVPFWYYAFNAILSPFLTQRTKSKFVFARPAKVTETLLKYIPAEDIPIQYGGLKRENDTEFSYENGGVSELLVKSGATETIEIPASEAGTTLLWDVTVLGWEVTYKEEFVPVDEGSYTIIIQKGKKIGSHEEPIRNSFRNSEPGKIVLTIENGTYRKKRVLYRHKVKSTSS